MSLEDSIITTHNFTVLADHGQILLEHCDQDWDLDLDALYDAEAMRRHVGAGRGLVVIRTARLWGEVSLELMVRRSPPDPQEDFSGWDNVAEVSLEAPSGCLAADGPESSPSTHRIEATPGVYRVRVYRVRVYRVRVYAGGVGTVDEYMQYGHDYYRAVLWPAPYQAPVLLYKNDAVSW